MELPSLPAAGPGKHRAPAYRRAETAVVKLLAGRSQGVDAGRPVSLGCQV